MPTSAPRPCTYPGCGALVHDGTSRCKRHKTAQRQLIDQRRGSSAKRGYGSRWQKARATFLGDNPTCRRCGQPATVVDHVVPHKGDQELFWDLANWQPLCKRCHDAKTAREDGGFGN